MLRGSRWARALTVLALGAGLMTVPASAAENEQFPGLPEASGVQYIGALVTGLGGSARAKQFFLIPIAVSAIDVSTTQAPQTPARVEEFNARPGPPPCDLAPNPNGDILMTVSRVYPVSPPGSPDAYGTFAPITVRTVALGSVPSEAVISIALSRDEEGLPTGLVAHQAEAACNDGTLGRRIADATVEGTVTVSISDIEVDGVDLQLHGACRAVGTLDLVGQGFLTNDPDVDRDKVYAAAAGGFLTGTLDLSEFTGCARSTGEDVSPLISGLVSGPDNPVEIRQGAIGACFPSGDLSWCTVPDTFDLSDTPDF